MAYTTTRLGILVPDATDDNHYTQDLGVVAAAVDKMVPYSEGTSFPVSPVAGQLFRNTSTGVWSLYNGSAWQWASVGGNGEHIGDMKMNAANIDPVDPDGVTRWMICDGRAISRTTYLALYTSVSGVGASWPHGQGNGSTTFNIPDMRGRMPMGPDPSSVRLFINPRSLGQGGGEEVHTLVLSETPSHTHSGTTGNENSSLSHAHSGWTRQIGSAGGGSPAFQMRGDASGTWGDASHGGTADGMMGIDPSAPAAHTHNFTTTSAGSGNAHQNMPHYLAINFLIKVL